MMVREEIILRHLHQSPDRLIDVAIYFYIFGLTPFFAFADWSIPTWAQTYYVWQMVKDMLLLGCIYLIAAPKHKPKILPILMFSAARAGWELISFTFGKDVNSIMIVDYFFLLVVVIAVYQFSRKWLAL